MFKDGRFFFKKIVFYITFPPYNHSPNGAAEYSHSKTLLKNVKLIPIFRFILSYNSTKHCATGVSPAELHFDRMLPIPFNRLNSFARNYDKNIEKAQINYRGNREKIYLVNDTVMCKNYGTGDAWVPGIILKLLSTVGMYLVNKVIL